MSLTLAHIVSLVVSIPMALDGEAQTTDNTGLGVISLVSIVLGYAGLFALWFFAFRNRSRKRKKDSSD